MQRLGGARARTDGGGVVYDNVGRAWLQPFVDGSIEVGRRCALGLDQRGVEIVIEQVQPQDIRWLRDSQCTRLKFFLANDPADEVQFNSG
jgi:hypothetical protein